MRLGARQGDGHSLRWHLQIVYDQTGEMPAELDVPPLPHELEHVWGYFLQMNRKRTSGMTLNPLADSEILAWQRRQGIVLTPFEGECIDALDEVFLAQAAEDARQTV